VAGSHHHLTDSDAQTGEEVQVLAVLDDPPRRGELRVDERPGAVLCRKARAIVHEHVPRVGAIDSATSDSQCFGAMQVLLKR
jgi:hypothetical protein